MKNTLIFKACLFLALFYSSTAGADTFIALAPSMSKIGTPSASTRPLLADFRLGYEIPHHQLELAIMTSIEDDQLNQLTIDIPSVASVFYRYIANPKSDVKFHLIVGASQIEVESSYPGIADSSDQFDGFSYGIGLEEAFRSIPDLKIKFDWISLYDGDQITISTISLGLRYEF
ncbi:MAG: porin family protein [Gammaproteobacteria bacterium]|nr:porin family protein [Gammaproteobacteria bacterium]MCW8922759.1 porin family protein [Gammaproteobacteria bacterium]